MLSYLPVIRQSIHPVETHENIFGHPQRHGREWWRHIFRVAHTYMRRNSIISPGKKWLRRLFFRGARPRQTFHPFATSSPKKSKYSIEIATLTGSCSLKELNQSENICLRRQKLTATPIYTDRGMSPERKSHDDIASRLGNILYNTKKKTWNFLAI